MVRKVSDHDIALGGVSTTIIGLDIRQLQRPHAIFSCAPRYAIPISAVRRAGCQLLQSPQSRPLPLNRPVTVPWFLTTTVVRTDHYTGDHPSMPVGRRNHHQAYCRTLLETEMVVGRVYNTLMTQDEEHNAFHYVFDDSVSTTGVQCCADDEDRASIVLICGQRPNTCKKSSTASGLQCIQMVASCLYRRCIAQPDDTKRIVNGDEEQTMTRNSILRTTV